MLYSSHIDKINRKGKTQKRVLLVTNRAMYNIMPSLSVCKRRIPLQLVTAVTLSSVSNQFILHVPSEYDYHYSDAAKEAIMETVRDAKFAAALGDLEVRHVSDASLDALCTTRVQARAARAAGVARPVGGGGEGGARALSSSSVGKRGERGEPATRGGASEGSAAAGAAAASGAGASAAAAGGDLRTIREEDEDEDEDGDGAVKRAASGGSAEPVTEGWSKRETSVRLSDFDLLRVIGRGSFGKVMLVRRKGQSEVLAMKILSKAMVVKRNQLEHTRAERAILESIDHPFLVRLRYAFQTPTKLYMVMPFLRGGELFFHLRKAKRFTEAQARFFAAEIALGIGHLHSKGIVYRDLKPENILLDDHGHVSLTDFGLAKALTKPGEKTETFCGTPEYLAPEVICDEAHDKEVDWWALGILTYEMMHGLPPFFSSNVQDMYDKIESSPVPFPDHFSGNAMDFINKILAKDPRRRLGSGDADVESIKAHPFFESLDWAKLEAKELPSPFKPIVRGAADTSNFDKEFTSEPVVDSVVPDTGLSMGAGNKFEGFTFVDSGAMATSH